MQQFKNDEIDYEATVRGKRRRGDQNNNLTISRTFIPERLRYVKTFLRSTQGASQGA